jgi:hypothetical protein
LLVGIIRLKNGKQLTTQRIPDEFREFRVAKYNTIVKGPRASTGMAVIAHKDDLFKVYAGTRSHSGNLEGVVLD